MMHSQKNIKLKQCFTVPLYKGDRTNLKLSRHITVMEHVQNVIQLSSVKVTPHVEEDFDVADQLLVIYSALAKYSKRNGNKIG